MAEQEKQVELFPTSNILKQGLYCIIDFKSLSVLPPFIAQNDEEAQRNFTNLINYSNSSICRFPDDFKLYKISDYVVSFTGKYDIAQECLSEYCKQFTLICSGASCKADDTIKFDELQNRIDNALKTVSNSNNVLVEQIGNVPNLQQEVNKINAQLEVLHQRSVQLFDEIDVPKLKDEVDKINSQLNILNERTCQLFDEIEHEKNNDNLINKLFK